MNARVGRLMLNAGIGAVTAAYGAVALLRPSALDRKSAASSPYFARMYAARAIPLGLAVAWDSMRAIRAGGAPTRVLGGTAAAAQVGDALVGLRAGEPGQVAGALLAATVHLIAGGSR